MHRGSNTKVAYGHREGWRAKYMDARTISLGMWVTGFDDDGLPTAMGPERKFNQNLMNLQSLFWRDEQQQFTLTKRWKDPVSGTVLSASTLAELTSDLVPEMRGPYSARLVVDLWLADPLFYGPDVNVAIPMNTPTVVNNPGTAKTSKMLLEFNGILGNGKLTNQTFTPDIWVQVGFAIAGGDAITLDVQEMTAIRTSDSANLIGAVTRSGSRSWMRLAPGANTLELTATSGSGTVDLTYAPAYL